MIAAAIHFYIVNSSSATQIATELFPNWRDAKTSEARAHASVLASCDRFCVSYLDPSSPSAEALHLLGEYRQMSKLRCKPSTFLHKHCVNQMSQLSTGRCQCRQSDSVPSIAPMLTEILNDISFGRRSALVCLSST